MESLDKKLKFTEQDDPQTYAIIGAAMSVHQELGSGFLEAVYQEALAIELKERGVPFIRECELPVFYKMTQLNTKYRVDFYCYDAIPVEIKALSSISDIEIAQEINYLKICRQPKGLLLNFGAPSLQYKRFKH